MGKLSFTAASVLAAAFGAAATAQTPPRAASDGDEGFFRPSADPALTAIRPPPAPRRVQPSRAGGVPSAAALEAAEEIRKAEEAQMDRAEAEHAVARAEMAARTPAITSPLDGTARILSPLDGTAPILSPVSR